MKLKEDDVSCFIEEGVGWSYLGTSKQISDTLLDDPEIDFSFDHFPTLPYWEFALEKKEADFLPLELYLEDNPVFFGQEGQNIEEWLSRKVLIEASQRSKISDLLNDSGLSLSQVMELQDMNLPLSNEIHLIEITNKGKRWLCCRTLYKDDSEIVHYIKPDRTVEISSIVIKQRGNNLLTELIKIYKSLRLKKVEATAYRAEGITPMWLSKYKAWYYSLPKVWFELSSLDEKKHASYGVFENVKQKNAKVGNYIGAINWNRYTLTMEDVILILWAMNLQSLFSLKNNSWMPIGREFRRTYWQTVEVEFLP